MHISMCFTQSRLSRIVSTFNCQFVAYNICHTSSRMRSHAMCDAFARRTFIVTTHCVCVSFVRLFNVTHALTCATFNNHTISKCASSCVVNASSNAFRAISYALHASSMFVVALMNATCASIIAINAIRIVSRASFARCVRVIIVSFVFVCVIVCVVVRVVIVIYILSRTGRVRIRRHIDVLSHFTQSRTFISQILP